MTKDEYTEKDESDEDSSKYPEAPIPDDPAEEQIFPGVDADFLKIEGIYLKSRGSNIEEMANTLKLLLQDPGVQDYLEKKSRAGRK